MGYTTGAEGYGVAPEYVKLAKPSTWREAVESSTVRLRVHLGISHVKIITTRRWTHGRQQYLLRTSCLSSNTTTGPANGLLTPGHDIQRISSRATALDRSS